MTDANSAGNQRGMPEGSKAALDAHRRPDLAHLKHQAQRYLNRSLAPSCAHCIARDTCEAHEDGGTCILAETRQAEVLEAVRGEAEVTPASEPVAQEYAKTATLLQIIDVYIAHGSPFLPGAPAYLEPQPVLKLRSQASSRLQSLANELGLTPAAKARLQKDNGSDAVGQLAKAMAELSGQPQEAIEGEYEAETEGGGADGAGDRDDAAEGDTERQAAQSEGEVTAAQAPVQ